MGLRISTCSHCVRHKLLLLPNCSCKGTPSSPLKPSKKPRPIFLLPFTLNIISLNINIETIIHPDIIHTPSYIYIKGIYIIRYIIINSQSRRYTSHVTPPHTHSSLPHATVYSGLCSSFTFLNLRVDSPYYFPLVSGSTTDLVFSLYIRVHAHFVPKTQQASLPNEAGFKCQRSKLHWQSRLYSFLVLFPLLWINDFSWPL